MLCNEFTDAESKDRTLQQRVRRLHSKLSTGSIVNPTTSLLDNTITKDVQTQIALGVRACQFLTKSTDAFLAVKSCSDTLDHGGFVKLSKREPFAGKLIPGKRRFDLRFNGK